MGTESGYELLASSIVAQRHFIEQFSSSIMASLGISRAQFDAMALHIRGSLGVTDKSAPGADVAEKSLPGALAELDKIMAEIRRQLPE